MMSRSPRRAPSRPSRQFKAERWLLPAFVLLAAVALLTPRITRRHPANAPVKTSGPVAVFGSVRNNPRDAGREAEASSRGASRSAAESLLPVARSAPSIIVTMRPDDASRMATSGRTAPPILPGLVGGQPQRELILAPLSPAVMAGLRSQDAADISRRLRIGISRPLAEPALVNSSSVPQAAWLTAPDGSKVWAIEVTAPGALGLRVHLEKLNLPAGTRVIVYDPSHPPAMVTAINAETLAGERETWTPTVFAERVLVECQVPPGAGDALTSFTLTGVSHLYRTPQPRADTAAGACNVDASCFPAWAVTAAGVAEMEFVDGGDVFLCTGCLLNDNDPTTVVDYFLTAHHCIPNQSVASTLELIWFYQSASCNGPVPAISTVPITTGGATFLAGSRAIDFALLLLRQAPPAGVTYLGWTAAPPGPDELLTCIHHPEGDFKRINFGHLAGVGDTFWEVQWTSGVTEPGSSGSPLLNADQQIVGQLFGGNSSCADPAGLDVFGRFDATYPKIRKWIDAPPPTVAGSYNGLFFETNVVRHETSGFVSLKVTPRGTYSGYLLSGGSRLALRGQLNGAGGSTQSVSRRDGAALTVDLNFELTAGSNHLTGEITDGLWIAELQADRASSDAANGAGAYPGKYTIRIPGGLGAGTPDGDGFGAVLVNPAGKIALAGSLADGTTIRQSVPISSDGWWPLYASLYGGKGSVLSWIANDSGQSPADLHGQLSWIKPAQPGAKLFPAGFAVVTAVTGSRYHAPAGGAGGVLDLTSGIISFTGGDVAPPVTDAITLSAAGKVTSDGGNKLSLNFVPATGLFRGNVTLPGTAGSTAFRGAVLQGFDSGYGYFPNGEVSGRVVLQGN